MTEFIFMLTYNDVTRKDAIEVYESIRDVKELKFVGFKNIGLEMEEYKKLVKMMKEDGKTIFLEVVSDSEEASIESAKVGLELGVDYLIGTFKEYIPATLKVIEGKPIKFMPYIGEVVDHPCILKGTIEEMQADVKEVESLGIAGINLLAYRHATIDVEELIKKVMEVMKTNLIVAGSIKTPEQVKKMKELNVWAFTIGGAIFDKKFVKDGSHADNIKSVLSLI
ncbi:MAG: 4-hydroxythreonine-4-phosphate dehydrogenase [Candidatus Helarchaeota archaeon]